MTAPSVVSQRNSFFLPLQFVNTNVAEGAGICAADQAAALAQEAVHLGFGQIEERRALGAEIFVVLDSLVQEAIYDQVVGVKRAKRVLQVAAGVVTAVVNHLLPGEVSLPGQGEPVSLRAYHRGWGRYRP